MARDVQVIENLNVSGGISGGSGQPAAHDSARVAREHGYTPREWDRLNAMDAVLEKKHRRLMALAVFLSLVVVFLLYGIWYVLIRSHDYHLRRPYDRNDKVYGFSPSVTGVDTAASFSRDLCVIDSDLNAGAISVTALSGGLFDLTERKVLYARDLFTKRSPASMTKVMTAYVALKYGNLDDIVTVTDTAKNIEYGSSVCDIKTGDQLSLKQLVYGMLVASGNDAAMMIAEHVGGSVDAFVEMMNEEALALGATRTHFVNPHGLTADNHYTCAYDMYLMFRAASESDLFMDMISRKNYYAEYKNIEDNPVAVTWETTNHYLTGQAPSPDNVIIYGGKTGTTEDAGACLVLMSKDLYGNPFLSVLMHSQDKDILYDDMNAVLSLVA